MGWPLFIYLPKGAKLIIRNLVGTAIWVAVAGWLVMNHVTSIRLLLFALGVIALIIALYVWRATEPEEENV